MGRHLLIMVVLTVGLGTDSSQEQFCDHVTGLACPAPLPSCMRVGTVSYRHIAYLLHSTSLWTCLRALLKLSKFSYCICKENGYTFEAHIVGEHNYSVVAVLGLSNRQKVVVLDNISIIPQLAMLLLTIMLLQYAVIIVLSQLLHIEDVFSYQVQVSKKVGCFELV